MSSEQRALPSRSHPRLSRPNSRVPSSFLPVCRQSPPTARVAEASRSGSAGPLRSGVKSLQSDTIVARRGRLPISLPADDDVLSSSSCLVEAVEEVVRPAAGTVGRGGFGQSPRSPAHTARPGGRISSHIPISPGHKSTSPGVFRFSSTMHHSSSTSLASSGRAEPRGSPSAHQPLRCTSSPPRVASSASAADAGPRGERLADALGSAVREGLRGFSPVSALSRRWYDWRTSAALSHTQSLDEDRCSPSSAPATVPSSPTKKRVVNNVRPAPSTDSSACGFMSTCPAPPSIPSPLLSPTSGAFPPMIPSPLLLPAAAACRAPPVAVDVVDLAGSVVGPCGDEAAEDVEAKKTMGFQITSVTQSRLPSEEEDSEDDEPLGVAKLLAASSLQLVGEATAAAAAEEATSWQTRFRIINIQTGVPFWRGRWQCVDYLDRQQQPTSPCPAWPADVTASGHALSLPSPASSASSSAARTSPRAPEQLQLGASPPRQLQLLALHRSSPQTGTASVSLDDPQVSPGRFDGPAEVPAEPKSFLAEPDHYLRQNGAPMLDMLPAPASSSTQSFSPASSSVADKDVEPIDNKIEQAMDLVKSHLLLAVREEVDVLKANITKLVDRIGSLERENAVLRGSVSADVLAQLEVPSTASSATAASSSSSVTPTGPLSRV